MSKPINPKYLGENGIHRVPLWRIGGFALNNTATNLYLMMMGYVSFYLMGWVGIAQVAAGSFAMMMRLWDGVTDPIVGFVVGSLPTVYISTAKDAGLTLGTLPESAWHWIACALLLALGVLISLSFTRLAKKKK